MEILRDVPTFITEALENYIYGLSKMYIKLSFRNFDAISKIKPKVPKYLLILLNQPCCELICSKLIF